MMKYVKLLFAGLLLLSTIKANPLLCGEGYEYGFFGCYYIKQIQVPGMDYQPPALSCDNSEDLLLSISGDWYKDNITLAFVNATFHDVDKIVTLDYNNTVVGYVNVSGIIYIKYICYKDIGATTNETIVDALKQTIREASKEFGSIATVSLYLGSTFAGFRFGGLVGATISAWTMGLVFWALSKLGFIYIPTIIYEAMLGTMVLLTIVFLFTYFMKENV